MASTRAAQRQTAGADPTQRLGALLDQAERVLSRLEGLLSPQAQAPDWEGAQAFRWRRRGAQAWLQPVAHPAIIRFADLQGIDEQKSRLERNTRQFVAGRQANNVLLTGARGTGKSSLVKGCLHAFAGKGLRLVEMDKTDLVDLPDLVDLVRGRAERFVVFCDDLSFDQGEPGYKALKSVLDGSVAGSSDNLLVYATSNRRHLLPEFMQENLQATHDASGEVHPGEGTEEKVSLSDRFGLWLSFYPFDQEHYLRIAEHWLQVYGLSAQQARAAHPDALLWALERGSRSGRVAWQFARDFCGRKSR